MQRVSCFVLFFVPLAILVLLSHPSTAQAQSANHLPPKWRLEKDKNGIQVFSRITEESRFKQIKVLCEIDGTLSQLYAFLSDISSYTAVVYKTKEAYLLKQVSDRELFYYTETSLPWPVKNRDLLIHMTFLPDPGNKQLIIKAENAQGFVPVKPDKVRIPYWRSVWTVVKKSPSRLRIEYVFTVDPGGDLPVWLINLTAAMGPYASFINLEENLKLPRYQGPTYSFLNF